MRDDPGYEGDAGGRDDGERDVDLSERSGDDGTAASGGNVAGEFRPSETIEPGTPSLANALFVIAGAYLAVLSLTQLFVDVSGFDGRDLLVLTGGTLLVSLVLLGFFGLLTPDT